jgi:TP901 family phage tail tape measure protein
MANFDNDKITLTVDVKATDAHGQLLKLQNDLKNVREELEANGVESTEFTKDDRYKSLIKTINEYYATLKSNSKDYAKSEKENQKEFMAVAERNYRQQSASMKELLHIQKNLRAELNGTKENDPRKQELERYLGSVENRISKFKKDLADVKIVMKLDDSIFKNAASIGSASLNQLKNAGAALEHQIQSLNPATLEYIETSKRLALVNSRIHEIESDYKGLNKTMLDGKQILNTAIGFVGGEAISEGLQVVQKGFNDVIDDTRAYGKALSELEAITGASGASLKDLETRAEGLTEIVTEGGNKITNTATDILTAFKLVGSAKPEILGNAEALQSMTKEAIIFQKASGLELPEAVKFLTSTMSQFNAEASESGRYINAIAAGAKEGASEIPDVSAAIEEFGAGAKSANFSIEESVALVETLGDKMIKGGEAGTALRNILIAVKAPESLGKEAQAALKAYNVDMNLLQDNTKSGSERLRELSKIVNDATAMVTVFGKENVTAAEVLLRGTERFDQLTKSVTGTNEAYRQAAAMTNNLDNDIDNLKDTSTQLFGEFSRTGVPVIRQIIQGFISFLKSVKDNWDTIVGFTKGVSLAILTVSSYYATVKVIPAILDLWAKRQTILTAYTIAYSYVTDVLTGKIKLATIQTQLWSLATKANPVGLIVAALTAAVSIYTMYASKVSEAVQAQRTLNEVNATAQKNIAGQKVEMEQLLVVARNEKLSKDERAKAIEKLNQLSPQYLGNLKLETINTDAAKKATDAYIQSLEKKARTEAATQRLTDLEKQKIDLETGQTDIAPSFLQQSLNFVKSGGNAVSAIAYNAKTAAENYNEKIDETKRKIETLKKYITDNKLVDVNTSASSNTPSVPTDKFHKGDDKKKKEIELLAGSLAYLREEVNKLNKEFENTPESKTPEMAKKLIEATRALWQAEEKLDEVRKKAAGYNEKGVDTIETINILNVRKKVRGVGEIDDTKALPELKSINPSESNDVQLAKAIKEAKEQLDKEYYEKKEAAEDAHQKKIGEMMQTATQFAQIASDAIFAIAQNNSNHRTKTEMKNVDMEYDKKIKAAKGNKKEVEKLEKERDQKREQIEKEAFERNKRLQIMQSIMNGAFAITKILAETPKFDFGIATAIGIGLAIATTAAQVATISSQKYAKGGIFKGASHNEGGIAAIDTKTGQKVGEMEGGEPYLILSKETYKNNRTIIDALLDASLNGGGKPILKPADTFIPNESASSPITTNVSLQGSTSGGVGVDTAKLEGKMDVLIAAFEKIPTELKAYVKFQDLDDAQALVNSIKNKAFGK